MNSRTKEEVLAAWRKVLTADLPDEVTAAQVAGVVGIAPVSARQWLNNHVGKGAVQSSQTGWLVKRWPTAAIRAAVEAMEGPGNRSGNRGKGRHPKAASSPVAPPTDQPATSQEGPAKP